MKQRKGMQVVSLEMPWPPSLNECKRPCVVNGKARLVNTKALRDYYRLVKGMITAQGKQGRDLNEKIALTIDLYPPHNRAYDISNRIKALEDALCKSGVIRDDRFVKQLAVNHCESVKGGRVNVKVEEI